MMFKSRSSKKGLVTKPATFNSAAWRRISVVAEFESEASAHERSGASSWEEYAEELDDLMRHAGRMFKMFRRPMRRGRLTPSTLKKLRAVLDEALAKIEALVETEGKEPPTNRCLGTGDPGFSSSMSPPLPPPAR
jgi:hypothetical protein